MRTSPLYASAVEAFALFFTIFYGYAAFSKLWDVPLFLMLSQFQPGVNSLPNLLKWIFPLAEISLAILLLFTRFRRMVFYIISLSLSIILLYRFYLFVKGIHLPCLCGPVFRKLTERQHLVLDAILLFFALSAIFLSRSVTKSPRI